MLLDDLKSMSVRDILEGVAMALVIAAIWVGLIAASLVYTSQPEQVAREITRVPLLTALDDIQQASTEEE